MRPRLRAASTRSARFPSRRARHIQRLAQFRRSSSSSCSERRYPEHPIRFRPNEVPTLKAYALTNSDQPASLVDLPGPEVVVGVRISLARLRERMRPASARPRLILDLVPNHVAPDHPWVNNHPDFFIEGTEAQLKGGAQELAAPRDSSREPHPRLRPGPRLPRLARHAPAGLREPCAVGCAARRAPKLEGSEDPSGRPHPGTTPSRAVDSGRTVAPCTAAAHLSPRAGGSRTAVCRSV